MSEIFNDYIRIAREQGLVSQAEDKVNPRYDSQDLNAIELLYHVRPNGKDEKEMIDQAHPESVIIAPSYDRLNGLVENEKERHNIMVGIINKPHQGKLTQHRYAGAKAGLMDELLRIGFLMDSKHQDDLRILADTCAENLVKKSWTWAEVGTAGGVAGGAVGLGLLGAGPVGWGLFAGGLAAMALINHFGPKVDQGTVNNCTNAIKELEDVLDDGQNQNLTSVIQKLISIISYVKGLGEKATRTQVPAATVDNAARLLGTPQLDSIVTMLNDYEIACETLAEKLPSYINLLKKAPSAKENQSGFGAILNKVVEYVYPAEITDAISALETLHGSLKASHAQIIQQREEITNFANTNKTDIIEDFKAQIEQSHKSGPKHHDNQLPESGHPMQIKDPGDHKKDTIQAKDAPKEDDDLTKQLVNSLMT